MDRIRSGNAQLDTILGGGFPANAIHIVMGSPGSGKTILAEQLAFANATAERPALYLTTVSEPLPKFLAFLHEYTFADTSRVGTEVIYTSIADAVAERAERIADNVAELIEQHRPRVIIIDSFKALADLMPDRPAWRRCLHELAGLLSAYSTTSIWVGEYTAEMRADLPEFAVADGIVELAREQHGSRDFRFIHVVKLRGSNFLDGYHAFRITGAGLEVYPRLRTAPVSLEYAPAPERLGSGVAGLDALIATGWLRGTSTVVMGPSGAGKTVLGLQFLREGAARGEAGLLVTLEENPTQVARVVNKFGWDAASLLRPGKVDVLFASPVELPIDSIVGEIFERVERQNVRRVVLDGIADLAYTANDPVRFRDYVFALTQQLATRNVTSMFTIESGTGVEHAVPRERASYLGDNLLLLEMHLGEDLTRTVRVLKTRGSSHDTRRHRLTIGEGGVLVE